MEKDKNKLAELLSLEVGKPIKESKAEIDKCIYQCNYYLENSMKFLEDEKID